ncbi:MAG: hypothetical protein JZU53_10210 [Paludibacter sp.]|nr:hypothetical protein [Paludibacter sp.]
MKAKFHILYVLMLFINLVSCNSNVNVEASTKPSDTITIGIKDVFLHKDPEFTLQVDSILNDSRCPIGAQCFWEGNAEVRFKLSSLNSKTVMFNLNTANIFRKDTIIEGIKFKLIELNNQPDIMGRNSYQSYRVKIYYSTLVR